MVPPESLFGAIPTAAALYTLSALVFGASALVVYRRCVRWLLLARPAHRLDRLGVRLRGAFGLVLGQRKVLQSVSLREDRAGLAHVFVFWGFLGFLASYLVFLYGDAVWPPFSTTLLTETGVRVYVFGLDILAVGFFPVLGWAALRRFWIRPPRLAFDLTQRRESALILLAIGLLMGLSVLTGAFHVAAGGTGPHASAPVGAWLGGSLAGAGLRPGAAQNLHALCWWAHVGVILGLAVYVPLSKHMHVLAAPLSLLTRSLEAPGALSTPLDLRARGHGGAGRLQDFTWRELLDGYACAVCGRCTESCPAHVTGKILSPMHIVDALKEHALDTGPALLAESAETGARPLIGGRIEEQALWDCLTCGACVRECPVGVEHVQSIVDMRRHLVLDRGKLPDIAMSALLHLERRGHPWRGAPHGRTEWAEGLDVPTLADHPRAEVLLWVGCTAALEPRSQGVARATASVLKRAGVDFAILGDEERCTGDPARRIGDEYLFQKLAQHNIETLRGYGVKKIVTVCAHCFNTLRNEYPHLGGVFDVRHSTELIAEEITAGRLRPSVTVDGGVAYHDSCYLGRGNGLYAAPRRILASIPGARPIEMARSRERSFCCGAGGGHLWIEEGGGERVSDARTDQFLQTPAQTVAVSCPFCLQMFADGIATREVEHERQARDLVEILEQSLGEGT